MVEATEAAEMVEEDWEEAGEVLVVVAVVVDSQMCTLLAQQSNLETQDTEHPKSCFDTRYKLIGTSTRREQGS